MLFIFVLLPCGQPEKGSKAALAFYLPVLALENVGHLHSSFFPSFCARHAP
jgi:hypothetical protein